MIWRQPPPSRPDEGVAADFHVVEEDLVEVVRPRHVVDRADRDPLRPQRHDQLRQPLVPFRRRIGPGQEVDVVGMLRQARPDLVAGDPPPRPGAGGPGADTGEVAAGLRLRHADAVRRLPGQDLGQVALLLRLRAVVQDRRTHLPVGEPVGGQRSPRRQQQLRHAEPVDVGPPPAAAARRPGEPDPAAGGHLLREVPVEAGDPGVDPGREGPGGPFLLEELRGFHPEGELVVGEGQVHLVARQRLRSGARRARGGPCRRGARRAGRGPARRGCCA